MLTTSAPGVSVESILCSSPRLIPRSCSCFGTSYWLSVHFKKVPREVSRGSLFKRTHADLIELHLVRSALPSGPSHYLLEVVQVQGAPDSGCTLDGYSLSR
jgi:hypothetical protein